MRGTVDRNEHVPSTAKENICTKVEDLRQPHSPDSAGVLIMPGGGQTMLQGIPHITTSIPLSFISTYTPLGFPRPLPPSAGPTDLIGSSKITILTKPITTSLPGLNSSPSNPSNKPYFVTEPFDSPKSSHSDPTVFEPLQTPQLTLPNSDLIQPKPSRPL